MITAGFDIGTRFFKICLTEGLCILASFCGEAGRDPDRAIRSAYRTLLRKAGLTPRLVEKIIATGHGADLVRGAAYKLLEPACIARAVHRTDPCVRTVVDVGSLFIRIVSIDENGFLEDSLLNEPCAAGSGKFLELVCDALDVPFQCVSEHAAASREPYVLTSTCAVFAESEVISQINAGARSEDILAGIVQSIVSKVVTLLVKSGAAEGRTALIGGVSAVPLFREELARAAGRDFTLLPLSPQMVPAYGAALLAQGRPGAPPARKDVIQLLKKGGRYIFR